MSQQRLPSIIYHIAEEGNWPFIQQYGLISAQALLEQAGLPVQKRSLLEQQRTESLTLPRGIRIRDQKPMPPTALERCLHEMTPAQWYSLLNARVFFWLDPERLNRMRGAMKERPQVVLSIDTERLLARYAEHATLTPINTGNARRQPARRGAATFVPYTTWLQSGWLSESQALDTRPRPRSHQPVELTITPAVPDVLDFITHIQHVPPLERFVPH
ncbi:DUF7002 family protein [Ktedonobacter robiniae]|uniref:Uncharacterized protein n=1 Tax=Ktedonobacter robiniae TaxID=2778365 RepID=A0ABQ3USC0_9CHLR|nr:hypothetical protein [Ktedonobacter robiniae]GHO55686.1 hypothetical protein KSB_41610 [Ktedonobacter robiniae]